MILKYFRRSSVKSFVVELRDAYRLDANTKGMWPSDGDATKHIFDSIRFLYRDILASKASRTNTQFLGFAQELINQEQILQNAFQPLGLKGA